MIDRCEVLVHTCVDPRFDGHCRDFARANFGPFAFKSDAGGVKAIVDEFTVRPWIFLNWDVLIKKFGCRKLVLVQHGGCAAYEKACPPDTSFSAEEGFHRRQVELALAHIQEWRFGFPVEAYFAHRNGSVHFSRLL